MTEAVYSWLKAHPLTGEAIIGMIVGILIIFMTPVLSPIVTTFWKFCSIPPQRLSVWLLKARLSSAESQSKDIIRLGKDPAYLMYACFKGLGLMGVLVAMAVAGEGASIKYLILVATHSTKQIDITLGRFFIVYACLSMFAILFVIVSIINRIKKAVLSPRSSLKKLALDIARLEEKLRPTALIARTRQPGAIDNQSSH